MERLLSVRVSFVSSTDRHLSHNFSLSKEIFDPSAWRGTASRLVEQSSESFESHAIEGFLKCRRISSTSRRMVWLDIYTTFTTMSRTATGSAVILPILVLKKVIIVPSHSRFQLSLVSLAGSYWFNGMVPHGVLTSNSGIQAQTYQFLDYVLTHQEAAGWLGPEAGNNRTRYLWGRYPFFFGAIQMVEYNSSLTDRVVAAMHKFVPLANEMIRKGEGLEIWTNTRWEDFVMTLQWLYDYHPNGNEDLLLDTMLQLKWSGVPWEEVFTAEVSIS